MDGNAPDKLAERVQALLAETFQISPQEVASDLAFGDLPQWDSLGHMDVMMRLEERFGIEINTDVIAELTSIPAICAYIQEQNHG